MGAIRSTIKMFGISWTEFLVIVLVAMLVIPARMWPDVARFLANLVDFIRRLVWKITDASEKIKQQIDLEKPIDEIISSTDIIDSFSTPIKKVKKTAKKVSKKGDKK